ncbi:hypothetical protein [Streptomyces sp. NRRL WC-3742]|uniref:hypothetical protein n=1 Tax=Streptomyces sp. NRRL WC-3742 TaxID=1463934 RepID=UPI0004C4C8F6|nr:hypothetical protein [Streptomyces sp. NRRL WC-3742]
MRRPTRHPRRSAGTIAALVGTLLLLGPTACSSPADHPDPAARAAGGSAAPVPPTPVTRTMPSDITPMLLPSTGAETRWSQGLDTFATLAGNAATRACAHSRGTAEPDTMPGMFLRTMDIPDLPFIQAHGFSGGFAPGEPATGSAGAPKPPSAEQQQCLQEGKKAAQELKGLYAPLQSQWYSQMASLRHTPDVQAAYQRFNSCLAEHGVKAKDEDAVFAQVDQLTQDGDTTATAHLGEIYAACMAPVEAVREPIRAKQRDDFRAGHAAELAALSSSLPKKIHEFEERYGLQIAFPTP